MKTKKLWALLIAAVMVIGLLPVSSFAEGGGSGTVTMNIAGTTLTLNKANGFMDYSAANAADPIKVKVPYATAVDAVEDKITFTANGAVQISEENDTAPSSYGTTKTSPYTTTYNTTAGGLSYLVVSCTYNVWTIEIETDDPKNYTLKINGGGIGSSSTGGTTTAPYPEDPTKVGSEIGVSAPLNNPSKADDPFDHWNVTGLTSNMFKGSTTPYTNPSFEFYMPSNDVTLTAVYRSGATAPGGSGGTVTPPASPGTGSLTLTIRNGYSAYVVPSGASLSSDRTVVSGLETGETVNIYASGSYNSDDHWTFSPSNTVYSGNNLYDDSITITMGTSHVTATWSDYGIYDLSIGSATGGSASADDYTITSDTQKVKVSASASSGYYFSGWSKTSNISYASGYSSSSNPTYIYLSGDGTITPSFTYGYDPYYYGYGYGYGYPSGYYPGGVYYPSGTTSGSTSSNSNANEFGTGTLKATVTSTGVTAGYNASGSINSTNTVLAVQRYFRANASAKTLNLSIPMGATAMSTSTARKIMNAAGTGKTVNVVGNASFGTVSYALTTARNYYFQMSSSSSRYTAARNTIVRAYGNSDTRGFSMQVNSLGASGTFKIKLSSLGLSAGPGDTVYALFYNPTTNGFTRKTLVVNSAGEVNYATARGGVHLFSETPFAK